MTDKITEERLIEVIALTGGEEVPHYEAAAMARELQSLRSAQAGEVEVKRYVAECYSGRFVGMTEHPKGQYVHLTSYQAAEARANAAEAERDEQIGVNKELIRHARSEGMGYREDAYGAPYFVNERAKAATEALTRIAAVKYPAQDTHYALKATIDYARDQASETLSALNGAKP